MAEHYRAQHSKSNKGKIALIIIACILGFAIIGAGAYALVHYVIMPATQATESTIPEIPSEPTYSPTPTQAPTEAPTEPEYETNAEAYLSAMSDYEKICQLFIVTPETLTGIDEYATVAGDMTKDALKDYPVGGIIYFSGNLEDVEQTEELIKKTQSYAQTPLFIDVDEEGGTVARVADKLGTKSFDPMFTYKDKGADTAHDNAEVIASNIRALGFNMDNAPVADVLTNPDNTVIGERAYSDDYEEAAELVAAAVEGFKDGGVISALKHFPGHGDTDEDSHDELAHVTRTVEELKQGELLPFKSGIEAGADMVMAGHLVIDDLDPELPATLSSKVIPSLLREELGYDGIVITDSMTMAAVTENYSYDEIITGLFNADVDIILCPDDLDSYIDAIQKALDDGAVTMEQIDAKVRKILALKFKEGIMTASDIKATAATTSTEAPSDTETTAQ